MRLRYLTILLFITFIAIGAASFLALKNNNQQAEDFHLHAGFVVFKDNKQIDFSDPKYMLIKPCTIDEDHEEEEDLQIEKAHLHDQIGDVVHVEIEGAKWEDLFTNIEFDVDYGDTTAYLNGEKVDNFQELSIGAYDSLVILVGSNDKVKFSSEAVTKDHIIEAEKRSEDCG